MRSRHFSLQCDPADEARYHALAGRHAEGVIAPDERHPPAHGPRARGRSLRILPPSAGRQRAVLHIGHIVPRQHGGVTGEDHLALACPHCHLHKGPNLTGIDPDSGEVCRLFHPRRDVWAGHFRDQAARLGGRTAIGRTTAWVPAVNAENQLRLRSAEPQ